MIEDNTQDVVKYRLNMEADNFLVRSRARFIIGKVCIFGPEEEKQLQQQLGTVHHRFFFPFKEVITFDYLLFNRLSRNIQRVSTSSWRWMWMWSVRWWHQKSKSWRRCNTLILKWRSSRKSISSCVFLRTPAILISSNSTTARNSSSNTSSHLHNDICNPTDRLTFFMVYLLHSLSFPHSLQSLASWNIFVWNQNYFQESGNNPQLLILTQKSY